MGSQLHMQQDLEGVAMDLWQWTDGTLVALRPQKYYEFWFMNLQLVFHLLPERGIVMILIHEDKTNPCNASSATDSIDGLLV